MWIVWQCSSVILVATITMTTEGRLICHHDSYIERDGYCYRYVVSSATYSQATERCGRDEHGTSMLYINSDSEESYIWSEMFLVHEEDEFWLGMDDIENEGDFRWSYNRSRPIYTNFSSDIESVNNEDYDCVRFTASGWQMALDFCENLKLPYICKAPVCESSDGVICDAIVTATKEEEDINVGIIAAIVVIILILVIIISVVVVLLLLWKFKNDTFRHYICPCVGQGSKKAVMSLQQENQRLRQELNQSKMNSSSRFNPGQFTGHRESVVSNVLGGGVPDGMGGILPPLKSQTSIRSPMDLPSSLTSPSSRPPPPLSFQRGHFNRVTPMTPSGPPPLPPSTHKTSITGGLRGVAMGGASLPTVTEHEEDSSTASEDDDDSLEKVVVPAAEDKEEKVENAEVKGEASNVQEQSEPEVKGQTDDKN